MSARPLLALAFLGVVSMAFADTLSDFNAEGGGFQWVNTHSKPCTEPDGGCEARDGEVRTLAQWTEAGLPRTGWSACGGNCKCGLVPMLEFAFGVADNLDEDGSLGGVVEIPPEKDPREPFDKHAAVSRDEILEWADDQVFVGETAELIAEVIDDLESGRIRPDEARDLILEILAGRGVKAEDLG